MDSDEQVYIKLQQHLDRQAVGFPATRSGVEIKILKYIFTPQEAEVATCLSYRMETVEAIFEKAEHLVGSAGELEAILDRIVKKGGIELKIKEGRRHYCNAPLVVGMYEFQVERLTLELVKYFDAYFSDRAFGIEFLSTELPQMRTIPVARSIHPRHNVSTFDEVMTLLQRAETPFVILECICRKKKSMEGKACRVTDRRETCLALGSGADMLLVSGIGREITRDDAVSIIEQNQKDGLVLQPANTEKPEFICSCCGCCCGMLSMHRQIPKPLDYWVSNFYAAVDAQTCTACGVCQRRCQVGAVAVSEKTQLAVVNPGRCLGCGLCVTTCPAGAITLVKKPVETRPPETREELFDIIMANKKRTLGKIKLGGKFVLDAIRTGQTHLLKS